MTGCRPLADSKARSAWRALRAMRRYVKAKRVAVAGEHYTRHAHHATASWSLGMAVFRRAHWLRLQSIEQG